VASRAVAELCDGIVDIFAGCCLNFRGGLGFRGDLCLVREFCWGDFLGPWYANRCSFEMKAQLTRS